MSIMRLKDIFQVTYVLSTFILSHAEKFWKTHDIFGTTMEYIQEYNGMDVQDVVVLSSSSYLTTNGAFHHELIHSLGMWNMQVAFMTTTGNISKLERSVRLLEFSTAIIFLDFETSEDTFAVSNRTERP